MSETLFMWGAQLLVSGLDFVMMYIVAHALMKKYIQVELSHVLLGVVLTVVTSVGFQQFGGSIVMQIVGQALTILSIKLFIPRAKGGDLLIIYLISSVLFAVTQASIFAIVNMLDLNRSILFTIAQIFTLLVIVIICKNIKWYRLFHMIRSNFILKSVLAILAILALVAMFVLNLETDLVFFTVFATSVMLVVALLSPLLISAYQRVNGIITSEDLKTDLFLTAIEMVEEPSAEEHYQIYTELAKIYGVDIASLPADKRKSEE